VLLNRERPVEFEPNYIPVSVCAGSHYACAVEGGASACGRLRDRKRDFDELSVRNALRAKQCHSTLSEVEHLRRQWASNARPIYGRWANKSLSFKFSGHELFHGVKNQTRPSVT
jgi:hypothetical protein